MMFRTSMLTPIWANQNGPGIPNQFAGMNSDITPFYDNGWAYYTADLADPAGCPGCPTVAAEPGAYHPMMYPATYGHKAQHEFQ